MKIKRNEKEIKTTENLDWIYMPSTDCEVYDVVAGEWKRCLIKLYVKIQKEKK